MNSNTQRRIIKGAVAAVLALGAAAAVAHHSFALYDMEKTLTFTGVVTRVTVARDGSVTSVSLDESSGRAAIDAAVVAETSGERCSDAVGLSGAPGRTRMPVSGASLQARSCSAASRISAAA